MNLQNFKEVYTKIITESTDDSDLRNYIRTIVEEVLVEENEISITKRKYPKLRAAIKDISDPGYRRFPIITSYATEAELDKFEKLLSTKDGLQNAELKKFMKRFEPRGISGTKSYPRNPSQDEFGYPDSFKSLDPFVYSKEELIVEAEGRIVISKKFYPKLHAAIRDVQEPFHQQYPIYNRYDDAEHDEASFRAEHDRLEKILGKPVKTNAEIKEIKAFLKGYDTAPKRSIYNRPVGNRPGEGFDKDGYPDSRDADKLYNNNPDRYK